VPLYYIVDEDIAITLSQCMYVCGHVCGWVCILAR